MREDSMARKRKELEATWLGLTKARAEVVHDRTLRVRCAKGVAYQNGQILMQQSLKLLDYTTVEIFTGRKRFIRFSPGRMAFLATQVSR